MLRRTLIACVLAGGTLGCDYRPEPTLTPTKSEKRSDVHIQAPGVKIDVEKKER